MLNKITKPLSTDFSRKWKTLDQCTGSTAGESELDKFNTVLGLIGIPACGHGEKTNNEATNKL